MKQPLGRISCRMTALFLSLVLLFVCLPFAAIAEEVAETVEEKVREADVWGNDVRVRSLPGTNSPALSHNGQEIRLWRDKGHTVTVKGDEVPSQDSNPTPWFAISFQWEGVEYQGYLRSDFIRFKPEHIEVPEPEPNLNFEEQLALFPESYHASLRALHELHPSWNFEVFDTGLDWNTVLQEENKLGKSLTNAKYASYYSTQVSYDWETDTHYPLEAGSWYQAAPALVAYYMDPRNFLTDMEIFQFEKLTFNSSSQTEETISLMLAGSFMEGATTVDLQGNEVSYAKAFLDAAYANNVSAFHLVSRCIQEVGWQGQNYSKGTFPGYEGYYNFFNIGSTTSLGPTGGMMYAKDKGWDTAYKAIVGGGAFIGNGYVAVGQDTPYFQKFSVVDPQYYYWHQYMTNIAAASSEGRIQRGEYVEMEFLESSFTFRIPVYLNMPASPSPAPAATGSSNNYLRALSVEGYSLTPSFDFYDTLQNGTSSYTIIIPGSASSVTVSATAAGDTATLSGHLGKVSLLTGENLLTITVTAASGDAREYTLRIIVNGEGSSEGPGEGETPNPPTPPEPQPIPSGWDPKFTLRGSRISGITPGLSVNDFIAALGLYGSAAATVTASDGGAVSGGAIRTGYRLNYYNGSHTTVYTLVLYGDCNGDSAVDAIDLLYIRRYLLGMTSLADEYLESADTNHDGVVDAIDLLLVRRYLLNLSSIEQ